MVFWSGVVGPGTNFRSLARASRLALVRSRFVLTVALRAQKLDLLASLFKFHSFLLLYLLCYLQNVYLFWFERLFYRFHSIWEQFLLFQFHDTAKKKLTSVQQQNLCVDIGVQKVKGWQCDDGPFLLISLSSKTSTDLKVFVKTIYNEGSACLCCLNPGYKRKKLFRPAIKRRNKTN